MKSILTQDQVDVLLSVQVVCEASDSERHFLWRLYSPEGRAMLGLPPLESVATWEQDTRGLFFQIGEVDNRPITLALNFAMINNTKYMFWWCPSQLADYAMVHQWLEAHMSDQALKIDSASFEVKHQN